VVEQKGDEIFISLRTLASFLLRPLHPQVKLDKEYLQRKVLRCDANKERFVSLFHLLILFTRLFPPSASFSLQTTIQCVYLLGKASRYRNDEERECVMKANGNLGSEKFSSEMFQLHTARLVTNALCSYRPTKEITINVYEFD
jgi:hypothetical protein